MLQYDSLCHFQARTSQRHTSLLFFFLLSRPFLTEGVRFVLPGLPHLNQHRTPNQANEANKDQRRAVLCLPACRRIPKHGRLFLAGQHNPLAAAPFQPTQKKPGTSFKGAAPPLPPFVTFPLLNVNPESSHLARHLPLLFVSGHSSPSFLHATLVICWSSENSSHPVSPAL